MEPTITLGIAGVSITIVSGIAGFMWKRINYAEIKLDKYESNQISNMQRIATLEEAIKTIKENSIEMKIDIKTILKAVN